MVRASATWWPCERIQLRFEPRKSGAGEGVGKVQQLKVDMLGRWPVLGFLNGYEMMRKPVPCCSAPFLDKNI